ncbi:ATP-dependent DNA helicase-like protein recQ [Morchella snyderi]|nr:ATP-dependent DNA helicase-like protein recQ [Morchella snyderi]
MRKSDDEDFGLSSDDEADMVELASTIEGNLTANQKRPIELELTELPSSKKTKQTYPSTSPLARKVLQEIWGYPAFRLKQEEAISRLIAGGSAVVIFPTGGGKSLVYQVPALALDQYEDNQGGEAKSGLTLVISPLIALMKDQVDALKARGVKAAAIDSSQTRESVLETYDLLRRGELKLLYCAPERLNNEGFVASVKHLRIRLIAVDEAHCISEWGQAFRPDYLKVARFVKEIEAERVLCLTATATPRVAADICKGFDIPEDGLFRTTTYRENLEMLAESFTTIEDKMPKLKQFLGENPGSTIVYVTTHQQTQDVSEELVKSGIPSLSYHAGMETRQRLVVQEKFMTEKNITIVATIAFGMGIDKADIRNVVHYDFPRSLEGYSQEIGRAGRDGLPSKCALYLCSKDWQKREIFCRADLPSKKSIDGLLNELFDLYATARKDDVIEANLYQQSKKWDIKITTLGLLYSQLELRFELLRAITPKYSKYTFKPSFRFDVAMSENCLISTAIITTSGGGKTMRVVDVDLISDRLGCLREEVVRKLQDWSDKGYVELKPSGVVNRYRMMRQVPRRREDREPLISSIYKQMELRETADLRKGQEVINLITGQKCFAAALADHFGDTIPHGKCGECQWCKAGVRLEMDEDNRSLDIPIDQNKIRAVLAATASRDDPRFLAKIAFGISSPRVVTERCGSKSPVFGSMAGCNFEELVEAFSKHCSEELI